jgi:hypothetical protein
MLEHIPSLKLLSAEAPTVPLALAVDRTSAAEHA